MPLAAAAVVRLRRRHWRGGRAWRRDDGRVHHDAHDEPLSLLAVARLAADEAEEARWVDVDVRNLRTFMVNLIQK